MPAKAIMFQGTGSDVGKSLIVAGLARVFSRRGLRVRPFKPQNMSNNAAVAIDGGEIGRAQALQARAAGIPPSVHMNPVLLKPHSETGAQIIVQGRMKHTAEAADYVTLKQELMTAVLGSFNLLISEADLVLVEGAGSASEVNLRAGDIANMGFAYATHTPVILIGDIERGGVIASIVGTKAVLSPGDAGMIEGYIVNKFRGDPTLFDGGLVHIGALTGWRSLGLVPYFDDAARLPAEDALALDAPRLAKPSAKARIAVLAYPRISNFDDFDPLRLEPSIELLFLRPGTPIPADCDLVILPGSKATIADLDALRACGWDIDLRAHVRRGGRVLGICGGYQMLGRNVSDPDGMEGRPGAREGLGLLDVKTHLTSEKLLVDVSGRSVPADIPFTGYEMHVGRTAGPDCARPLLKLSDGRSDGACSVDGRVTGCHVHGLFSDDRQRSFWMQQINAGHASVAYEADVDATLDALAKHLEKHIDIELLLSIARPPRFKS